MLGFALKPDLSDAITFQVEMFILSVRCGTDVELMSDDALRAVAARVKAELLRAQTHGMRIVIAGTMLDVEKQAGDPRWHLIEGFLQGQSWSHSTRTACAVAKQAGPN